MNHSTDVVKLQEQTGQSSFNCKRALLRTDNDMEAAADLLSNEDFAATNKLVNLNTKAVASLGNNISDYTIGSVIPYGNYRFTNVGVSSNVASSNATSKVLSYNGTVSLTSRGAGNASQSQIYHYRENRSLYPEYTRHRTPYSGYSDLAIDQDKETKKLTMSYWGTNIHIRTVRHDSFAPIVKMETPGGFVLAAKANGTGVEWVSSANYSSLCEWYAERIYRIEKLPGFTQGIEFFSAKTMSNMPNVQRFTDYALEDGPVHDTWLYGCEFLYMLCYGDDAFNNASNVQLYGNMYGALYSSSAYDGKFHPGIDINAGYGTTIRSPIGGTVVHIGAETDGKDFGRFTIKGDDGFYYTFLHLSRFENWNVKRVTVGDIIGYEGNIGLGQEGQKGSHLHFEVSNVNTYSSIPASSCALLGNTYYPYDICNYFV